jgi:hypothetical protein
MTQTPVFVEALAAVANCAPADAEEHFGALEAKPHPVETFLDEYVPITPTE